VVATIALILLAIHNYRVRKLLEVERMRVRIASDLHDDIGSSLSSIALITDMVRRSLTSHGPQQQQLMDVTRAAKSTADSLRDIVWIISPEHDQLDDIILRMKDSAAKLLTGTAYMFHCTNDSLGRSLSMEFRRNLLLLYKEALNNIAKYAKATSVDIEIREENGTLRLEIVDNGVGFDISQIQRGNGLNNMKLRAEKIGGSVSIESTPSKGTTIRLRARIP
jgi:signal transduction histidine kinase